MHFKSLNTIKDEMVGGKYKKPQRRNRNCR